MKRNQKNVEDNADERVIGTVSVTKDTTLRRPFKIILCIVLLLAAFLAGLAVRGGACAEDLQVNEIYRARLDNLDSADYDTQYIAISFDDTIDVFADLEENKDTYQSLFENDFLKQLEKLHSLYGACFSLYCYYENGDGSFNLSMMADQYAEEFAQNSSWLKLGFHAYNGDVLYTEENEDRAGSDYDLIISELIRITGSADCIDRCVRLSSFAGSAESIAQFASCEYGITGLLGPDDDRNAYFLTTNQSVQLSANGSGVYDGISILSTDIRLEDHIGETDLLDMSDTEIIVFTHEWALEEDGIWDTLEELCCDAVFSGYRFDFAQAVN